MSACAEARSWPNGFSIAMRRKDPSTSFDRPCLERLTTISPKKRGGINAPLVVYYSAHRSLTLEQGASKARAAGGLGAAYAEALEDRGLRLGEAALLWRKESVLEETDGRPARANRAVEEALPAFLGEFHNLRVEGGDKPRLVVDKRGTTLDLSQLSDGERGLLAVLRNVQLRS